jgi:hypothetical protein
VQAEKVQFVQHIKELPLKECRTAEMMLLCGQIQDAEAVYLQAGLIFRAIFLNLELFNFDRYCMYVCMYSFILSRWQLSVDTCMLA